MATPHDRSMASMEKRGWGGPLTEDGQIMMPLSKQHYEQHYTVADREYPQLPPHRYVPGPPSPLHYGVPFSDAADPGVLAVSNALFSGSGVFQAIPLGPRTVFRRRKKGDVVPEWSNAFVSRVDPCECGQPEETYTPYEVSRYRDSLGNPKVQLDFAPSQIRLDSADHSGHQSHVMSTAPSYVHKLSGM